MTNNKLKSLNIMFPASWKLVLLSCLTGTIMFFASELFLWMIHLVHHFSFGDKVNSQHISLFIIPLLGAIILGVLARYLDERIRGHGIPEVIERIELHGSKIPFRLLWLRPIACAISIGTGGPYGAEGPVIGLGGALGSTFGQIFKLNENERHILLSAGAAAGISAVFGTPVGAVFLVTELFFKGHSLTALFPIAISSLCAYIARYFYAGEKPLFLLDYDISNLNPTFLCTLCLIAVVLGIAASLTIHAVEWCEDFYPKLKVPWMYWPVIGAIPLSIAGYFFPSVLGPGYELITGLTSYGQDYNFLIKIAILKGIVWIFAVSSRTTAGTLAPLLILGGGLGLFVFTQISSWFHLSDSLFPIVALLSAGAFFGAISGAPVSSCLIVLEMSSSLPLLPYSFMVCLIATLITKTFSAKSIMRTSYY